MTGGCRKGGLQVDENNFSENITPEEIEKLPQAAFGGEIQVIDSVSEDYFKAVRYLRRQQVLGFDTETKPCFTPRSPHPGVALLQLSGGGKAFLFRVKALGMQRELCNILANPNIIKVGAATKDDVNGLQRYARFTPAAFVDLQKIVPDWGIRDKSVKKMAAIVLGVKVSKTQQLSNWEAETLSDSQRKYAATDAWICREMYMKLMRTELNPLSAQPSVTVESVSVSVIGTVGAKH